MDVSIPDKKRPEWKEIIMDKEGKYKFSNYVIQVQLTILQRGVKENKVSINQAVEILHKLISKYASVVQDDLKKIFKN